MMKTIRLREEDFATICEALGDALQYKQLAIRFLSDRHGPDSDQAKAEQAGYDRLAAAEKAFREDLSDWRRPKHRRPAD